MIDDGEKRPQNAYVLLGYDVNKAVDLARDQDNIAAIYTRVFGSIEGKAILFDIMARAKLGTMRPANMTDRERAYMDGWAAMVFEVLDLAGVDPYERVAALHIADTLPTKPMERTHGTGTDAGSPSGATDPDGDNF